MVYTSVLIHSFRQFRWETNSFEMPGPLWPWHWIGVLRWNYLIQRHPKECKGALFCPEILLMSPCTIRDYVDITRSNTHSVLNAINLFQYTRTVYVLLTGTTLHTICLYYNKNLCLKLAYFNHCFQLQFITKVLLCIDWWYLRFKQLQDEYTKTFSGKQYWKCNI